MRGRDRTLKWYVQHEPILQPDERARILRRHRNAPDELAAESRAFWAAVNAGHEPPAPSAPIDLPPHLDKFRRWRQERAA